MNLRVATIALAVMLGICTAPIFAKESTERDETQRVHERKVLLQLDDIGLKSSETSLPVTFCPHKKDCIEVGNWTFRINPSLEDKAQENLFGRINGNRYDSLTIAPGKINLNTLTETLDMDSNIKSFNFDTGSFGEFKSGVENYLAQNVAPLMSDILNKAKDARYQEMKDKEKETFLATVAKEQSVPARSIERLMNSAFVFSSYAEKPGGSVTISEVEKTEKKKKYFEFRTSVDVNLTTQLLIHRYNANSAKFEHYKTISGASGDVSASAVVFPSRPGIEKVISLFDDSLVVAAKASGISLNISLIEDPNFAIFEGIAQVDGSSFLSPIGENEDLRVDEPYKIFRTIDDRKKEIGWAKARSVASKITFKNDPANYSSRFYLMSGNMEIADQIEEHPWSGFLWFIDAGTNVVKADSIKIDNATYQGAGTFGGIRIGAKSDLGFMLNAQSWSERWFEISITLAGGGNEIAADNQPAYDSNFLVMLNLDMVHRKQLGSFGMYWGYKYGLGGGAILASNSKSGSETDDDMTISTYGINLGLQTGFAASPNFEMFVNAGTYYPLFAEAKIKDTTYETELSGDLNISVGFAWHSKKVGGFARLMK